jgi:hypothetical protein
LTTSQPGAVQATRLPRERATVTLQHCQHGLRFRGKALDAHRFNHPHTLGAVTSTRTLRGEAPACGWPALKLAHNARAASPSPSLSPALYSLSW